MTLASGWVLFLLILTMVSSIPPNNDTERHKNTSLESAVFDAQETLVSNVTTILINSPAPACEKLAGSPWGVFGGLRIGYREGTSRRMEQILAAMQHYRLQVDYQHALPNPNRPFRSNAPFLVGQLNDFWYKTPPVFLADNITQARIALIDDPQCERETLQLHFFNRLYGSSAQKGRQRSGKGSPSKRSPTSCDTERVIVQVADVLVVNTPRSLNSLSQQYGVPHSRMFVLPIVPEMTCDGRGFRRRTGLMYMGGLNPLNQASMLWFSRHVYPVILAHIPAITLTVLGRIPKGVLPKDPSVRILGLVTDNVMHQVFADSRVFVAPMVNTTGVSTKVLAAIEHCVPVVSTRAVEEGFITGSEGKPLETAEAAQEFAEAVIRLYEDEAAWQSARRQQIRWNRESAKLFGRQLDLVCAAAIQVAERRGLRIQSA